MVGSFASPCYVSAMNYTVPQPISSGWLEAMEESDAQLAAGQVVPLSVVLEELQGTIVEIEAKLAAGAVAPKAGSASLNR